MKRLPAFLLNATIFIVITLGSVEIFSVVYAKYFNPDVPRPDYKWNGDSEAFWGDINKDFGVWHYPNIKDYSHSKDCFAVHYTTNSYGARDMERTKQGSDNRIIALGDSFIEGWGLADRDRLTNLLESTLSREVLNFGSAGTFGPLQYYLAYKSLAKDFTHSTVLVGILPDNDFSDLDREQGEKVYGDRYRPYLAGNYPDYQIIYNKEFPVSSSFNNSFGDKAKRLLRSFSYAYNTHHYVKMLLNSMGTQQRARGKKDSHKVYAGYYDFTDEQFDMLRYCLEKIKEEAVGKTVVVVTFPRLNDFMRLQQGPPLLPPKLKRLAQERGFRYIDLLPLMYQADNDFTKYFFSCDKHWGIHGTKTAARVLAGPLEAIILKQEAANQTDTSH